MQEWPWATFRVAVMSDQSEAGAMAHRLAEMLAGAPGVERADVVLNPPDRFRNMADVVINDEVNELSAIPTRYVPGCWEDWNKPVDLAHVCDWIVANVICK